MKISIESTGKLVEIIAGGESVLARVWQGETESGIPVQCFITRIVPVMPRDDPRHDEFQRELVSCADPRPDIAAISLRYFID